MGDARHDWGYAGEQNMGFILGERGYQFIDGPSGSGGHGITTSGYDGVAFNPKTGDLILGDNKTFRRTGNVTSATAIDPHVNLQQNLQRMIDHIENHPNLRQFPNRDVILQRLRTAQGSVTQWVNNGRPNGQLNLNGVRLVVFNAGGNSTGVGGKLARSGAVEFQDLNTPPGAQAESATPRVRVAAGAAETPRVRVATQTDRVRVATETPRVRVVTDAPTESLQRPAVARCAVTATLANLAAGHVLGMLQTGMKEGMLKSLENLKQPDPDPRTASKYFSDPNTAASLRFLDLLNKNLKEFGRQLAGEHAKIIFATNIEVALLASSKARTVSERLEFLSALRDELLAYGDELDVVFENLDTARNLGPKVRQAAKAAEQLGALLDRAIVADWLLKANVEFDEIVAIQDNLKDFSGLTQRVFKDVEDVYTQVQQSRDELSQLYWQLVKISWGIILTPLGSQAAGPDQKPGISQGSQRVLAAMGPGTPTLKPSQIRERVKQQPGDFIPDLESALRELRAAGKIVTVESRGQIIEAWRVNP